MKWSVRVANALHNEGIETLGQLAQVSRLELLRVPNLGVSSVDEIEEKLANIGLRLR